MFLVRVGACATLGQTNQGKQRNQLKGLAIDGKNGCSPCIALYSIRRWKWEEAGSCWKTWNTGGNWHLRIGGNENSSHSRHFQCKPWLFILLTPVLLKSCRYKCWLSLLYHRYIPVLSPNFLAFSNPAMVPIRQRKYAYRKAVSAWIFSLCRLIKQQYF